MSDAQLVWSRDVVIALDYGQFHLSIDEYDPDLASELLGVAQRSGIAQRDGLIVVVSPHQNNFTMPLRIEVWDAEPADDLAEWEEAFEVHLDIGGAGLMYASPTVDAVRLAVPAGSYHAIVTGRGFSGHGWPGSTTPGDAWRICCWPSSGPTRPARLREYVEPPAEQPAPVHEASGVAAAARIQMLLDDVSAISGARGTVRAERIMPGTRRKLYLSFRYPHGWLTSVAIPGDDRFTMSAFPDHPYFADADRIVPRGGEIVCTLRSAKVPSHVEFAWCWTLRPPDGRSEDDLGDRPGGPLFVPSPEMTLRFELVDAEPEARWPTTLVTVVHDNVPCELIDDLRSYWMWMLESGDHTFDLSGERANHARRRA